MKSSSKPSVSSVLRGIMETDLEMSIADIIKKARAKGLDAAEKTIVNNAYNLRSIMRKEAAAPKPTNGTHKPVAAPKAESPAAPKAESPATFKATVAEPIPAPAASLDLANVFANVKLVSKVADECGGVDVVREVTKVIQACGSVEEFLRHVELVASLKSK